jgi:norsolorinic acid ketoreductase
LQGLTIGTGIGFNLLKAYLARPNLTIIAGIRNIGTESSTLSAIPTASGTKLIIVKIDSSSETDAVEAVSKIQNEHNIHKLDVVIANAGLGDSWEKVLDTTPDTIRKYTEVNTIGPLLLFQATWPLLNAAKDPKFVLMATAVSSFTLAEQLPLKSTAYGASKAAATYIFRKVHFEHEKLTTVLLYPG